VLPSPCWCVALASPTRAAVWRMISPRMYDSVKRFDPTRSSSSAAAAVAPTANAIAHEKPRAMLFKLIFPARRWRNVHPRRSGGSKMERSLGASARRASRFDQRRRGIDGEEIVAIQLGERALAFDAEVRENDQGQRNPRNRDDRVHGNTRGCGFCA